MKTYTGGCHCGAVRYTVDMDLEKAVTCNCSHCKKKGFVLTFAEKEAFKVTEGEDSLTDYFFNKNAIRHRFCKTCGTQSFSEGVAFPQVAINVNCLDDVDASTLTTSEFNGKDA
jgi:hypothetical protein